MRNSNLISTPRLAYQTNTWGGVVGHPSGVTSPRDLFYLTHGSDEQALRDIARAGYAGFEIFDGNLQRYANEPARFDTLMRDTGLVLVAVYSGASFIYADVAHDEFARLEVAMKSAQRFGAMFFVVGGGAIRAEGPRDADYEALAKSLDRVVRLAETHGLRAAYHPHLGTISESPEQLSRILDLTEISLCPDTAHLVAGGGDAAVIVRDYRDRVEYVHFKDYADGRFLPLGEGIVDIRGVVRELAAVNDLPWWTVELDETDRDPGAMAAQSRHVLEGVISEVASVEAMNRD
ncbi:MAG: sugar phosphate isomerase/epimerase family protein [Candidatus Dormiibacterota bacterium]